MRTRIFEEGKTLLLLGSLLLLLPRPTWESPLAWVALGALPLAGALELLSKVAPDWARRCRPVVVSLLRVASVILIVTFCARSRVIATVLTSDYAIIQDSKDSKRWNGIEIRRATASHAWKTALTTSEANVYAAPRGSLPPMGTSRFVGGSTPLLLSVWTISLAPLRWLGWLWFPLMGVVLWRASRSVAIPRAREVCAGDPRPPVVYLRSFRADTRDIGESINPFAPRSPESPALAKALKDKGPPIAVLAPRAGVGPQGFGMVRLPERSWEAGVMGLIREASLVVVRLSLSHGLVREVQMIARVCPPERLVFFVPLSLPNNQAEARIAECLRAIDDVLPFEFTPQFLGRRRFVRFDAQWQPHFFGPAPTSTELVASTPFGSLFGRPQRTRVLERHFQRALAVVGNTTGAAPADSPQGEAT